MSQRKMKKEITESVKLRFLKKENHWSKRKLVNGVMKEVKKKMKGRRDNCELYRVGTTQRLLTVHSAVNTVSATKRSKKNHNRYQSLHLSTRKACDLVAGLKFTAQRNSYIEKVHECSVVADKKYSYSST